MIAKKKQKNYISKTEVSLPGFSLIEAIVVVGLISILAVLVSTFLSKSLSIYRIKRQSVDLEEKAAVVMRDFEKETRAASQIQTAEADELFYYRYFDLTSPSPSKVHYFMDGNQFKIGITSPVGVEPNITYPSQNEVIKLIVGNVTNTGSIFHYYTDSGQELTGTIDPAAVKMVELNISLDMDPNSPPAPITESTKVNLRNMKTNL